ncbi:ERG4/ERG24 ergosterol biosynthesis protein [Suhomyces tanzawaensis NRRL Y-17324]|uniref:Delta(14)-sterol reductase n=1 Tax=Suhomyces tanzawaensis NRRL Y-17324 TaxID=984487 RepID=A0A1E4SSL3_9ASCO|nr:ERG4/ERG24 ergosterol biosynthesis protein [Suhomyces tanzawaensis NRRL Y-17324]ODV82382.1 ERG4/ERG24 ergosterol biosynthesis protein [Suhomyces tanzawaensis NRRL Y-17324]
MLNPKTHDREFFGAFGASSIIVFLPLVVSIFSFLVNDKYSLQGVSLDLNRLQQIVPSSTQEWYDLAFDASSWKAYLAWFFGLVVFDKISPSKQMDGTVLRDGTVLKYNINGVYVAGTLLAILAARAYRFNLNLPELHFIYTHQLQLTLVTIIFSFAMSVFVYVCSFIPTTKPNGVGTRERILAKGGNSGNPIYDFYIGRELNPRIGSWDIKMFCELKPGMLLWMLINLSCLHQQYHAQGQVTDSLVLVNFVQLFYVLDGVLNEEGVLTMMDITTDGFGFMLAFGDLAWLPWSYSLQARYLALPENTLHLGLWKCALILALKFGGFYVFYSANRQKSDFRQGKLDHLKSIKTKTGSKLLCDGWWAISQHINYLGDWLVGLSWCLLTGFQTPLTYFYAIYFAVLLLHRQTRDDAKCREKYGEQWLEYQRRVPYKIIPYVY